MADAQGIPSQPAPDGDSGRPDTTTAGRRSWPGWRWVVVGVVALALVAAGGVIGGLVALRLRPAFGTGCSVEQTAEQVLPTVVTLAVQGPSGGSNGSGQVIDNNGNVLTNDHVISPAGSSGTIDVIFNDGRTVRATVVGRAPELDLAVVHIQPERSTPVINIGSSEDLRVGEQVIALGAPLGLSNTVTTGIVSAIGRDVPVPADNGGQAVIAGAIQTDAAINPGNSGGALVDCSGDLVGVNTAIATVPNASGEAGGGNVGIGFAIPVDLAMQVADQLIAKGSFTPVYFGAETSPISPEAADRLGLDGGLVVLDVSSGGPAAQAGLKRGDVITAVDGKPTRSADSIWLITLTKKAGDRVRVQYTRGTEQKTATVTLADQP
ncbi:PDZ domain-containing protein [Microlunatus elymi]|uniref:PDZ domain-containing protein n=1 Tax=Microlunatus elymi TaxID=2596828 RepID=A0A516Q0I8_9ACTN|nr:trypsin-like peptidase domain-containing protein [Microlunatus elymi]QDP96711.1 PDZ domain-containing protein [Microlunatus elymi]